MRDTWKCVTVLVIGFLTVASVDAQAQDLRAPSLVGCYTLTHAWADTVAHLPSAQRLPARLHLTDEPFRLEHPHGSGDSTAIAGLEAALRVAYPKRVPDNERYFQYWILQGDELTIRPLVAPAGFYLQLRPTEARLIGELIGYTDALIEDPHALAATAALEPTACR